MSVPIQTSYSGSAGRTIKGPPLTRKEMIEGARMAEVARSLELTLEIDTLEKQLAEMVMRIKTLKEQRDSVSSDAALNKMRAAVARCKELRNELSFIPAGEVVRASAIHFEARTLYRAASHRFDGGGDDFNDVSTKHISELISHRQACNLLVKECRDHILYSMERTDPSSKWPAKE